MPELSRAIGRVALVGLVLNVVIGSSVFGLPSVIAAKLGRASPWAWILAAVGNTASQHVIEANGFVRVGRERSETRLRDGSLDDTVVYDMLSSEYSPRLSAGAR